MRRFAVPLFWVAFAIVSAAQTLVTMSTHGHSPLRILLYQLSVWAVWIGVTYGVIALVRRGRSVLVHAVTALAVSIGHVAWWIALTVWIQPYDDMTIREFGPAFPYAAAVRVPLELILYCGVVAVAQALKLERSLANARLHALELQIQPHFLFNTLNAVSSLVRGRQNDEAVEVIAGLSDLLRYTLDHAGEQRVPLEQEAAMLERYLGIQRVRFADRLEIRIDVADDARRAAVPTLILQPLAENAIRHGIARFASAGRVDVRAFRKNGALQIEMFNTGTLASTPRGIGLSNTEERLRQLYGDAQRFDLRAHDGGVLATITIPWSEVA